MTERQPRMIPNPLWCNTCEGRGYVVMDAEWDAYAVRCPADRCPAHARGERARDPVSTPESPVAQTTVIRGSRVEIPAQIPD